MKILFYSDLHVNGKNKTYMSFLEQTMQFLRKTVRDVHPDLVVNLGDLFHTDTIEVDDLVWTWNWTRKIVETISGLDQWIIRGNHDTSDRNGEISSVQVMAGNHNEVFTKPTITTLIDTESVLVIPHTRDYEALRLELSKLGRSFSNDVVAIFSHIDIIGCRFSSAFVSDKGLTYKELEDFFPKAKVFNGHYHHPDNMAQIHLVGSPLHRDFTDVWSQIERGFTVWDTETGEVERITNPATYYCLTLAFEDEDSMTKSARDLSEQKERIRVRISVPSKMVDETSEAFSGFLWKSVVPSNSTVASIYQGSGLNTCSTPSELIKKGIEASPDGLDRDLLSEMGKEIFGTKVAV
jgi:DNA repair exonuclease SbcCD nuclease subunit